MANLFEAARTVSATEAAERYIGVQLKRTGRNMVCRCPWHKDKSPSLTFFPDGGFKCFGCQAKGTSIDVLILTFGIDARAAALRICADFGLHYENAQTPVQKRIALRSKNAIREDATIFDTELCAWLRTLDKIIDVMEAKERDANSFSEEFTRVLKEREAISYLADQMLEIFAKEDMDAAADLMNAYRTQRPKWKEVVRLWASRGTNE